MGNKNMFRFGILICWIIIAIILVSIIVIFRTGISGNFTGNIVNKNVGNVVYQKIVITSENLPVFLENQDFVKDLPKEGVIVLKLFKSDSAGEWKTEKSYVIKKSSVAAGDAAGENVDVIIFLNSKYVSEIGDLCNAIKKAKFNGDLAFESDMSQISFMWKYKGMLKYRTCFGL